VVTLLKLLILRVEFYPPHFAEMDKMGFVETLKKEYNQP
jgi:hypothetical protein